VRIVGRIRAKSSGWFTNDAEERVERIVANPPIEQTGNAIRIKRLEDRDVWRNVSISYEILTPPETALGAATGSGDLYASGLRGGVAASTGSGRIQVSDIGNALSASTGSGDIEITSVAGSVKAVTGSGSIQVLDIGGALAATTGSGRIRGQLTNGTAASVKTGSGSIDLSGVKGALVARTGSGGITVSGEPVDAWDVDAGSGSIRVELPEQAAFDLLAETGSGGITVNHPLTAEGMVRRQRLSGKVRGGGPLVALSSGSGSIRVD
jgi:hypothetical protein